MDLFRVYFNPAEVGNDGYPYHWHGMRYTEIESESVDNVVTTWRRGPAIKDMVRERDGHRCLRCRHPFVVGKSGFFIEDPDWREGDGELPKQINVSPCDDECYLNDYHRFGYGYTYELPGTDVHGDPIEITHASWRILTVHHLNGIKHDCRWWNLVSLCQRCHLTIQSKVYMDRPYVRPHSEWFKPFAAAFYADKYLGEELTRAEVDERLEELLALELTQDQLF